MQDGAVVYEGKLRDGSLGTVAWKVSNGMFYRMYSVKGCVDEDQGVSMKMEVAGHVLGLRLRVIVVIAVLRQREKFRVEDGELNMGSVGLREV